MMKPSTSSSGSGHANMSSSERRKGAGGVEHFMMSPFVRDAENSWNTSDALEQAGQSIVAPGFCEMVNCTVRHPAGPGRHAVKNLRDCLITRVTRRRPIRESVMAVECTA